VAFAKKSGMVNFYFTGSGGASWNCAWITGHPEVTELLPACQPSAQSFVCHFRRSVSDSTTERQKKERAGDFPALSFAPLIPRLLGPHTTFAIGALPTVIAAQRAEFRIGRSAVPAEVSRGHFPRGLPSVFRWSRLVRRLHRCTG